MKKLYKIVLFVIFVFVFVFLFAMPIGAEDVINDVPSDLGQQFKEKWLPLIIDFITALGGTSVGLLIIKTIFDKALRKLDIAKRKIEDSDKLTNDVKKLLEEKLNNAITKLNETQECLVKLCKENEDITFNYYISIKKQEILNNAILEVLKYLSNNDELVRKGYAKEIMKVVENAKKETEKENVV